MPKVWFITGSSRGLGRSLAEAVLEHGDFLVATARKPEQLNDLLVKYGRQIHAVALDVSKVEQARAAIAEALQTFGHIDVLVNNAGYANIASIEETTEEDWRAQVETNLWGVINVTRAALPILREQRSGHIVQVSSIGGRTASAGLGPYQTAKWAVEGFSEVLAREVMPLGINVTLIEPGAFRTDWAGSSMSVAKIGADYRDTVGSAVAYRNQYSGQERGNPALAAQAIITIANEQNPPLRLVLGSDAVQIALAVDKAKISETERWTQLSRTTDYDGSEKESSMSIGAPLSQQ